jgi:hypothetical protein
VDTPRMDTVQVTVRRPEGEQDLAVMLQGVAR